MTTADLAHAAEDVRKHLALRTCAVNDGALDNPDVIETVWNDREGHALTDTVLRTLLAERDALAARVAELERALADVDMTFRLSHGGGWCATCRWPMREGTAVVKTLAVVCEPCAADLAATAGRLDPTRLAARKDAELAAREERSAR